MGYRMDYQPLSGKKTQIGVYNRLPVLLLCCFVFFLFLVNNCWPEGAALMEKVLSVRENVLPVSALNGLADELRAGEAVFMALSDFFRKTIP